MIDKTKKFNLIIILLIIISIITSFFVEIKIILTILFFSILLIAYIFHREKIGKELIIAFLISLAWTSCFTYEYTTSNLQAGKINLFPLVSWTFGLVVIREIYKKIKNHKFLKITLIYIISLFLAEYIGYYFLGIKLNTDFPSLFGLGIIHAPIVWKIFYLSAGPAYILITDYLGIK